MVRRRAWFVGVVILVFGGLVVAFHLGAQEPQREPCFEGIAYDVHGNPAPHQKIWAVNSNNPSEKSWTLANDTGYYKIFVSNDEDLYYLNYDGTPNQGTGPVRASYECTWVDIHPDQW